MLGLIQDRPLLISSLLDFAATYHGEVEIVSRSIEGPIHRYGYKDAAKRDKLVDRLLDTPEYAFYFANKWADILRVKRRAEATRANGTFAFHEWIRERVASDPAALDYLPARALPAFRRTCSPE